MEEFINSEEYLLGKSEGHVEFIGGGGRIDLGEGKLFLLPPTLDEMQTKKEDRERRAKFSIEAEFPIIRNEEFSNENIIVDELKIIKDKKAIEDRDIILNKNKLWKGELIEYGENITKRDELEVIEKPKNSRMYKKPSLNRSQTETINLPEELPVIRQWHITLGLLDIPPSRKIFTPQKYDDFELIWRGNYTGLFYAPKYAKNNFKRGNYLVLRTIAASNEPTCKWYRSYSQARTEVIMSIAEVKDHIFDTLGIILMCEFPPIKH